MKYPLTDNQIQKARMYPASFLGSADIRGVYQLIFSFVKELIDKSRKTDVFIEFHLDRCGTIRLMCDFPNGLKDNFGICVIEALSCNFDLQMEQDSFKLQFQPDKSVISYDEIEYHNLLRHFTELAHLNGNIKILLSDHENKNVLQFSQGLETMLMEGVYDVFLCERKPINICFSKENIEVSVSMIYAYSNDVTLSYVNHNRTHDGGAHVDGLYDGLQCALQEYIRTNALDFDVVKDHPIFFLCESLDGKPYCFDEKAKILRADVAVDLNFVISITVNHPEWEGSVKRKLLNEEVYSVVKDGIVENLKAILDLDPSFFYSSRVLQKSELRKIESHSNSFSTYISQKHQVSE